MTATLAPETEPRCDTGSPTPEAWGEVRPDVADFLESLGFTSPSKQRYLQRKYDRWMASAEVDWDFGKWVLTYLRRSGSRPVDAAVGERIARKLIA